MPRHDLIIALAALAFVACASEEQAPALEASCAAYAENRRVQCPQYDDNTELHRTMCEQDRVDAELIGCDEALARFVICKTTAANYDCEVGPIECEAELDEYAYCRQRFAQATGCSRLSRDDLCEGQPQPHSFACLGTPRGVRTRQARRHPSRAGFDGRHQVLPVVLQRRRFALRRRVRQLITYP